MIFDPAPDGTAEFAPEARRFLESHSGGIVDRFDAGVHRGVVLGVDLVGRVDR